jgi:hypothetical protein
MGLIKDLYESHFIYLPQATSIIQQVVVSIWEGTYHATRHTDVFQLETKQESSGWGQVIMSVEGEVRDGPYSAALMMSLTPSPYSKLELWPAGYRLLLPGKIVLTGQIENSWESASLRRRDLSTRYSLRGMMLCKSDVLIMDDIKEDIRKKW